MPEGDPLKPKYAGTEEARIPLNLATLGIQKDGKVDVEALARKIPEIVAGLEPAKHEAFFRYILESDLQKLQLVGSSLKGRLIGPRKRIVVRRENATKRTEEEMIRRKEEENRSILDLDRVRELRDKFLENIDKFIGLKPDRMVDILIEYKLIYVLTENLEKFAPLLNSSLLKLIEYRFENTNLGYSFIEQLLKDENIKYFEQPLSMEVAEAIVNHRMSGRVLENLDKFAISDYHKLFGLMIDNDQTHSIAAYFAKIPEEALPALCACQANMGIVSQKHLLETWMTNTKGTEDRLLSSIGGARTFLKAQPWIAETLFDPTIKSQGIGSFLLIDRYNELFHLKAIATKEDAEILKNIATTYGVRALDILSFIKEGIIGSESYVGLDDEHAGNDFDIETVVLKVPLSDNPHLPTFIASFPAITDIYKEYVAIADGDVLTAEKNRLFQELGSRTEEQRVRIVAGKVDSRDVNNPTYAGLLYYTFPPATTLSRQQYQNLLRQREDRQSDIPEQWQILQDKQVALSVGRFELKEGERLDTSAWNIILTAIKEENKKTVLQNTADSATINPAEQIYFTQAQVANVGRELVEALADPKALNKNRESLLSRIYQLHRFVEQTKLTTDLSSRDGLYQLKEYVGDRMKDTIDIALEAFAKSSPDEYQKLVRESTTVTVEERAKKAMVKNIIAVLGSPRLGEKETNDQIKHILDKYGIHVEGNILTEALSQLKDVDEKDRTQESKAREILTAWLRGIVDGASQQRQAGKLSVEITHRLLGNEYAGMQKEMAKYEFKEGAEGGITKKMRFEVSKKLAHSVAGLNMGVCVAVDDDLWNKKEFSNVILWDEKNIARGGFHAEIVREGQDTYLSLPGINPSSALLGSVNPEQLYGEIIDYAKGMAKAIGAKGLLIPTAEVIHSNRDVIQNIVASKNYEIKSLPQPHSFSYSPYEYSWQDAYLVEA